MRRLAALSVAVVLAVCSAARATEQGVAAMASWKLMDKCAKDAQAAYPDNSTESNAKRDAKLKDCLNVGNLPPRQPYSAQPPR